MSMVGKVGYITVAVRGSQGPGEVNLNGVGTMIAWSKDPISIGAEVVVTAERSTRTVTVAPTGL